MHEAGYDKNKAILAHAVYANIVRQEQEIASVLLQPYSLPPPPLDRVASSVVQKPEFEESRRRHIAGSTFRDAFLGEAGSRSIDEKILRAALFHQHPGEKAARVSRADVLEGGLEQAAQRASLSRPWAFLSSVELTSGEVRHLPMLDFACAKSATNLKSVVSACQMLVQMPFVLLETCASYHLVGAKPVDAKTAAAFLGKAILLGPLVDRGYIGHQLIEGCAALRVSGAGEIPAPTLCYSSLEDPV